MDGMQPDESGSSLVSITVLSVTPASAGKLFALAAVAVDIDGIPDYHVEGGRRLSKNNHECEPPHIAPRRT
jgi:hypothetical protein